MLLNLKIYSNMIQGDTLNKLDLINTLRDEGRISKTEAAAVVDLFFGKMSDALADGDRVEIRGFAHFSLRNIKRMPEGIPEPVKRSRWLRKNCRFSNAGKS